MGDTLEERNKRRVQKHQMLQEFEQKKKGYMVAFILCWAFGFMGVHRYYLGHKMIGLVIAGTWLAIIAASFIAGGTGNFEKLLPVILVYVAFVFIELFLVTRSTDRANAAIREELEAKYYT